MEARHDEMGCEMGETLVLGQSLEGNCWGRLADAGSTDGFPIRVKWSCGST